MEKYCYRIRLCLGLLSFVLCQGVLAQSNETIIADSLIRRLPSIQTDSVKLDFLEQICTGYENVNPDIGLRYAQQGVELAQKAGRVEDLLSFYSKMGKMYMFKGDYKQALSVLGLAKDVAKKNHNPDRLAIMLFSISAVYQQTGDLPSALDYTLQAIRVCEESKNISFLEVGYINAAAIFLDEDNFPESIAYAQKALGINRNVQDINHLLAKTKAYETIGVTYFKQKNPDAARRYFDSALTIYKAANMPMGIATMYTQLANTVPDFKTMLQYGLSAKLIWDTLAPKNFYAIQNTGNIGVAYAMIARNPDQATLQMAAPVRNAERIRLLNKAETFLKQAVDLCAEQKTYDNQANFLDTLASVQAELGKYGDAFRNLKSRNILYDSIFSQDNKNKLASLDEKYQLAIRDGQLAVKNQALATQARQRWFMMAGLALLAIIGLLLYRQNRIRKRTNTTLQTLNDQLDEANNAKLTFMGILNHDLRRPVANLVNFLQLQKEGDGLLDEASSKKHAQVIHTNAENLLVMMEDLLFWSKGQMKNFTPQQKELPVDLFFEDIQKNYAHTPGISFEYEAPDSLLLYTDEHYLKTILRNLTGNAIKAVAGIPDARIVWKARTDGDRCILSISDNGAGATDLQLQHLYDGSLPAGIDSGLGLHLVRDFARAISCTIKVASIPGKGTEFVLSVPSRKQPHTEAA